MAPMKCIIDTDPGVDDALALLLALSSPELLIVAITLTHGNTSLSSAKHNLLKILYALERHLEESEASEKLKWPGLNTDLRLQYGLGKIEIVLGSERPIEGSAIQAKYFHGKDGLSDVTTRHPELAYPAHFADKTTSHPFFHLSSLTSTEYLMEMAKDESCWGQIGYVALGPLTSLAQFAQQQPQGGQEKRNLIERMFHCILVMGGAIEVPGNTSPVAEFNIFADPRAAQILLDPDWGLENLWIFPLDVTSRHTLPFETYKSLVDEEFEGIGKPSQLYRSSLSSSSSSSSTSSPSVSSPSTSSLSLEVMNSKGVSSRRSKGHLVHFTSSFLEGTKEVMKKFGNDEMEMHDPLVVWALIEFAQHHYQQSNYQDRSATNGLNGSRNGTKSSSLNSKDKLSTANTSLVHLLAYTAQDEKAVGGASTLEIATGWKWERKVFEIETTGTLTRGMMITDRRRSSKIAPSRQTNRALAAEELEARRSLQEQETEELRRGGIRGVKVVTGTPGSDPLRILLFKRIWGINIGLQ